MPFEAAKAVAATFCFNIRYALTPVFGLDFLSLCVVPEDPSFGRMIINRSIVRQCTEEANGFRALSREASLASSPRTPALSCGYPKWPTKSLRPKPAKALDMESGYGTDTDRSDRYICSPQTSSNAEWTAMNASRSATSKQYAFLSSPGILSTTSTTEGSENQADTSENSSMEENVGTKRVLSEADEDYDEYSDSTHSSDEAMTPSKRRKTSAALTKEARAAYMLMQLHMADATLGDDSQVEKRRRASS